MTRPRTITNKIWVNMTNSDREEFFRSECLRLKLTIRPGPGLSPQSLYVQDFWLQERLLPWGSDPLRSFCFRHYDTKPSEIVFMHNHNLIQWCKQYPAQEIFDADPEIQTYHMEHCVEQMHKKLNKINDLENLKKRLTLKLH